MMFFVLLLSGVLANGGEEISMTAGGDVMFGRYTNGSYRSVGGADPFAAIAPQFKKSDIAFVNLECPLMSGRIS